MATLSLPSPAVQLHPRPCPPRGHGGAHTLRVLGFAGGFAGSTWALSHRGIALAASARKKHRDKRHPVDPVAKAKEVMEALEKKEEGKPQKKKKKKHTANRREVAKTTNLAELGARMPLARHTTKKAAPIAPIDEEELHWMMTHKQLIEELQELDFDDFVRHQVKERFYGLKVDRRREAMIRYICIYGGDAGARRMINLKISQKLGIK